MNRKILMAVLFSAAVIIPAAAQDSNGSVEIAPTEYPRAISDQPGPEPEPPEPGELKLEPVNLTKLKQQYNKNTDRIPSFVGSLIGDQTIAVNLSNIENDRGLLKEDVIGIKTEGKRIESIQWGAYEKTTLKIWIDQEDVKQLMEAKKPLQELKTMLKNGDIRYESFNFANKVKLTLMKIFLLF